MIPTNITKEHIVSAIREIENNGYPITREPTNYYIKYNEKTYPAKYALSISNKFANGQELMPSDFQGGTETNEFLKSKGFEIVTEDKANSNASDKKIDLENLILEYDKNNDIFGKLKTTENEAMKLRTEFISDFPPDKILNLEIDNYVQGKKLDTGEPNRKTFCYKLEFRLQGFGSLGGVNAIKFGIYYSPNHKKYIYDEKKYHSTEEAYQKILSKINTLLMSGKQFTQDNDWKKLSDTFERIDEIKSIIKSKILSVYYPEKIVSINSHNGIKQILKLLFHIPEEEIQEEFMLNKKRLWEIKQNHPIMKNWSNFNYSTFIWRAWKNYFDNSNDLLFSEDKVVENTDRIKTGFWIVRAGETGHEEKDALDNNLITIHYGLHDFSSIKNKDEIIDIFLKNPEENHKDIDRQLQISQFAGQIWSFVKEIKKNDVVILPLKGRQSKWIAIGIVKGDYEYRNISENIKSTRRVEWLNKEIPKTEFDKTTLKFLNLPRTVFRIKSTYAIQNIIDVMKKYQILPSYIESLTESRDLEIVSEKNQEIELLQKQSLFSIKELSKWTYLSLDKLKEIEYLLNEKKQIIFYGPPGTSKTYVAKKFAEYFVQGNGNVRIIQFHQSYSYEDFIEGIKPKLSERGEAIGFTLQSGLLKNLVKECIKNPAKKYVLIIDEINRGNISKIFGELIYLLEYRDEKISLTYSPQEEFLLPSNLFIIGTMNSADRSIAFVDYALRRRFYFKEFYPDTNGDVLYSWYKDNNITDVDPHQIVTLLNETNKKISEQLGREYQIGYSYFMIKNLDKKKLENIIDYAIIPLIEQYFFGKKQKVEEVKQIWSTITNTNISDSQTLTI